MKDTHMTETQSSPEWSDSGTPRPPAPAISPVEGKPKQKAAGKSQSRLGLPSTGRIHIPTLNGPDIEFDGAEIAMAEDYHGKTYKGVEKPYFVRLSVYSVNNVPGEYVCVVSHLDVTPGKDQKYRAKVVDGSKLGDDRAIEQIAGFFVDPKTKQPSILTKQLFSRFEPLRKKTTQFLN